MGLRTILNFEYANLLRQLYCGVLCCLSWTLPAIATDRFGIQIIDESSGRGIPLAKLTTTDNVEYWTDNQGWVAFLEPGMMGKDIYFSIESPGYEYPKDGFGFEGVRLRTTPGKREKIALKRINKAERMYRITGNGLFRDSELLGGSSPQDRSSWNAGVMGSDSVQMLPYRGQLFWIWGDTNLAHYPLGNFHVTAATSPIPAPATDSNEWDRVQQGINLTYFTDPDTDRPKRILPDDQPGAIWLFGVFAITDPSREEEVLIAHYSRHLSLGNMVEHGIAIWDNDKEVFEKIKTFEPTTIWQHPRGQAVMSSQSTGDYIYFVESFANTRVRANLDHILDPERYESLAWDKDSQSYRWQSSRAPTSQNEEQDLIRSKEMPPADARYLFKTGDDTIFIHRSSIQWNRFRKQWILIGNEYNRKNEPSHLGEVWYAESDLIDGPWRNAVKIATHPKQTFYNPRQHPIFASHDDRVIYFEGTYTKMFSGNPIATPRYEYNQLLYRLDLNW
ncbi:hypothetical protein SH449x_003403 [Pirellulaceae bacterium SH449]